MLRKLTFKPRRSLRDRLKGIITFMKPAVLMHPFVNYQIYYTMIRLLQFFILLSPYLNNRYVITVPAAIKVPQNQNELDPGV
jgi:hypothetical protein